MAHGKNGNMIWGDVTKGSHRKVWWHCEKEHEWQASVKSRVYGTGCPYCAGRKIWCGFNDLATVNPTLARQWHPEKNGCFTSANVTPSSNRKVWWSCAKGHDWQAVVNSRTAGTGCPYCAGKKVWPGYNDLATTSPAVARQWHPSKNGELTSANVTAGSHKDIWWRCEKKHVWRATVSSRVRGAGCPYCAGKRILPGFNDLATKNPTLAAEWHPTKNGNLTPMEVGANTNKKVWWRCIQGHEWKTGVSHRKKTGCPQCQLESHTSFSEQAIFYYVRSFFTAYNRYSLHKREIDIYIPSHAIGIEHDGWFHHTEEAKTRDRKKEAHLKEQGVYLLRVKMHHTGHVDSPKRTIYYKYNQNDFSSLENAIKALFVFITDITGKSCPLDINIHRDQNDIFQQYRNIEKERSLFSRIPDAARYWHPEKNYPLDPVYLPPFSTRRVWWRCPKGHEWESLASTFSTGYRCPYCAGRKVQKGYNDLATLNPISPASGTPPKMATSLPLMSPLVSIYGCGGNAKEGTSGRQQ